MNRNQFARSSSGKVVTAAEAVHLIQDGDTVAFGGFAGIAFPEHLAVELEKVYLGEDRQGPDIGRPQNLTLVFAAGAGDWATRGLNHLAHPGLLKRAIGGHFGATPQLAQLAVSGQIEAYNLPQGVISHLFRDIAAGKPGHLSRVGLGTFVDPRLDGGKVNKVTTEDLVEVVTVDGSEYLFYKAFPINVAVLRGTTADLDGSITMEREALTLDGLAIATAAHNSGGIVIVQVERIADSGTLNPRQVKIPGILVDCVVVAPPEEHQQTFGVPYSGAFASEYRVPLNSVEAMDLTARKIIARRAAMELRPNDVVNLGIGMPEGVGAVAGEEKFSDLLTLTTEPGVIGGVPSGGIDFGAAVNAQAIIDQCYQFDFYDGGGLDIAVLGLAQVDRQGNINVSRFGPKLAGCGGFINISQNAKKVVFAGTFTAGRMNLSIVDGALVIGRDGEHVKFLEEVEQRTFSGPVATANGKEVLYITERCVMRLTAEGIELTEIAPGVDLQRDILDRMGFTPIVRDPKPMDSRIFRPEPMGLREDLLRIPFEDRFVYDDESNILFLDFSNITTSPAFIDASVQRIRSICEPLGHKVYAVVNYDGFEIPRELEDTYAAAVAELDERYYLGVTRFTSSAFDRAKLADALARRDIESNMYATSGEASDAVQKRPV